MYIHIEKFATKSYLLICIDLYWYDAISCVGASFTLSPR